MGQDRDRIRLGYCELVTSILCSEACFQPIILQQIHPSQTRVWCYRNHIESALLSEHTDIQMEKYSCKALPKASASVLAIVSLSLHYSARRHVFNPSSCTTVFLRQASDATENIKNLHYWESIPISSRKNMLAMLCPKHQHQFGSLWACHFITPLEGMFSTHHLAPYPFSDKHLMLWKMI